MAFIGSIAPRRKTATYGKHSRRLISNLSSATEVEFVQDAGAGISQPKGTSRHWQGDDRNASPNLLYGRSEIELRPNVLACRGSNSKVKLTDQYHSSPDCRDAAADDSLFDVPLSDDGLKHNIIAARKRRKVVPTKVVSEKHLPVYDDESLQRHIAAEARQGEGQFQHSHNVATGLQDSKSKRSIAKNQAAIRGNRNRSMSETSKDLSLGYKHNGTDPKAVERHSRPSTARKSPQGLLQAKISSHGILNYKTDAAETNTIARSTTPDTVWDRVYPYETISDSRSPHTTNQPRTPSRPSSAIGTATTPRQRELWNKLLVDNDPIRSPSGLDLPSFMISGEKPEDSYKSARSGKFPLGRRQKSAVLKARPKKIVESLHQSDPDKDCLSDDCEEMRDSSSSSGSKSEHMRSEASAADHAVAVQTSPNSDSRSQLSQTQDSFSNTSQTIPTLYGGVPMVTYCRQRSYLTHNDLEEAAMVGLPVLPQAKNGTRYGRGRLGNRNLKIHSMHSLEEFGNVADSPSGTMRSIHELREAGGNVRLVSELEAMLDDIGDHQPASTSIRRSKLVDLVTKLEEPANSCLFVDQGLESRLIADIGLGNDLITDGLLVAALLQLMTFSSSALLLAQAGDNRIVRTLIGLLESDQDLLSHARLPGNNMSKAAQADLKCLCSALLKSPNWRAGKPPVLSCQMLALQCLEYLVRQAREAGSLSEVLSAHAISRIVATSVPLSSTKPPQTGRYPIVCLELAVSILESCTISNAAECQASLWAGETLERVTGLLPLLSLWKGDECGSSRTLTLRLYLNLTNNSPSLCENFSTPEVIDVMFRIVMVHFEQLADSTLDIDKTPVLDDLILSLGSLINLADLSEKARQLILNLQHGGKSYLDILLELFMNKSKNAAEVRISSAATQLVALTQVGFLLGRD